MKLHDVSKEVKIWWLERSWYINIYGQNDQPVELIKRLKRCNSMNVLTTPRISWFPVDRKTTHIAPEAKEQPAIALHY